MNFYINYLKLEIKRVYKSFPKMLLSCILLLSVIGSVAFCAEKLLYANDEHDKAKVAFVTEDTSKLISMATMLLQSSESISSICDFVDTNADKADTMLKNHEVIASITIPEGFMDGLRHGVNVPISIRFSDNLPSIAGLFKELSYTATRTLASSQSGIFAQHDLYYDYKLDDALDDANYELNKKYLSFVFSRNSIFKKVNVTTTGNISVREHYIAGGITLFFLLFSMSFAGFVMNDSTELKKKLFHKISILVYFINKILIIFSMYYVMYLLIATVSYTVLSYNLFIFAVAMIPILICLSAVIVFLYELSPNQLSGIILIFIFTLISSILSGCLIPVTYLPDTLKNIGSFLPSTHIINVLSGILGHSVSMSDIVYLIISTITCYAITAIYEKKVRIRS